MNRSLGKASLAAIFLTGCGAGDPTAQIEAASPAVGPPLVTYSEGITKQVALGPNADLVQRFCQNVSGGRCEAGISDRLKQAGFSGQGRGVELANAFVALEADKLDGSSDLQSNDEYFWRAAYKVVLAREPDAAGAMTNLKFIQDSGERQQMLRALLQSPEFQKLP